MTGNDRILASLHVRFPDGPPADSDVRGQAVTFYPSQWTSKGRWPDSLHRPDVLDQGAVTVMRQELFERAARVRSESDAIEQYVRVCGWGVGTGARGTARVARALADPDVGAKLLSAHQAASTSDPIAAYASMWRGGTNQLKYLGPAFFTKWLYFSGYEPAIAAGRVPPLILDARVARALGWGTWGWSAQAYGRYLELAGELGAQWLPEAGLHVVEYGLFQVGARCPGK